MNDTELEESVRDTIMDVLLVLYKHGVREVHMGGLMRVIGVADESAHEHDDEFIVITDEFAKYMKYITERRLMPTGDRTIH